MKITPSDKSEDPPKPPVKIFNYPFFDGTGPRISVWQKGNTRGYRVKIFRIYEDGNGDRRASNYLSAYDMLIVIPLIMQVIIWISEQWATKQYTPFKVKQEIKEDDLKF